MKIKNIEIIKQEHGLLILSYQGVLSETLDISKKYDIEIKEHNKKRTVDQNALAWKLINEISKVTDNDEWDVYISALEQANVKADYILAFDDAEESLKRVYRVVKKIDKTREENNRLRTENYYYKAHIKGGQQWK